MRAQLIAAATCLALTGGCGRSQPVPAMSLSSDAVDARGALAPRYSAYAEGLSPPLRWAPVKGAGAYAIILDDPDAPGPSPFVHWLVWNVPGQATELPAGLPNTARLASPAGAVQGKNDTGKVGYFGPRPPSGLHHYHFKVFALDAPLGLAPDHADKSALMAAMKGHTLAMGELVATVAAPSATAP